MLDSRRVNYVTMSALQSDVYHLACIHWNWNERLAEVERYLTLPETNIAPENKPSQKETSIPTIHFQVLC